MASRGVNKVILIGNLGRDPEVRYTAGGTAVANFPLATSVQWTDRESGEKKDRTEWHRIVAWSRLGEICGEYLAKGKQVYIEGRLQTREWQDQDGNRRWTTEIVANDMQMLGSPGSAPTYDEGPAPEDRSDRSDRSDRRGPSGQQTEDDIPF